MARRSPRTGTGRNRTGCGADESRLSHKQALATVGPKTGRHGGWEIRQAVASLDPEKGKSHGETGKTVTQAPGGTLERSRGFSGRQ